MTSEDRAPSPTLVLAARVRELLDEHGLTVEDVITEHAADPDRRRRQPKRVREQIEGVRSLDTDVLNAVSHLIGTSVRQIVVDALEPRH